MKQPFDRQVLSGLPRTLLREGRWANARVYRVTWDGLDWVVKDFKTRSWWVRNLVGCALIGREARTLRRLSGIEGIAPAAFRVDRHALAARYLPGATLIEVSAERLNSEFFSALERLLGEVHARRVVHLDTRGGGNLLITDDGRPALIDFQSALSTRWLPRPCHRWLAALDMSGVYKRWLRHDPSSLGAARLQVYERMTRRRRLWIARGYGGAAKRVVQTLDR